MSVFKAWVSGPLLVWAFSFSLNWKRYENTNKSITPRTSQKSHLIKSNSFGYILATTGLCTRNFCFQPSRRNLSLLSCLFTLLEATLTSLRGQERSRRQQDKVRLRAVCTQQHPELGSRHLGDAVLTESIVLKVWAMQSFLASAEPPGIVPTIAI